MLGDLTWDTDGLGAHRAWSGQLCVGSVQMVGGGKWWFDATYAVRMRDTPGTAPNSGHVASFEEAKAALTLAWETWLRIADLRK